MYENDQYYESINSDDVDIGEEYFYDTYDKIIDTIGGGKNMDSFIELGPGGIGFAFAIAESLAEDSRNLELNNGDEYSPHFNDEFDVDENTDSENWEKVRKISSLQSRHNENSRIRPFEQYINDICRGRKPLFDV
jgi:hypothetical protein